MRCNKCGRIIQSTNGTCACAYSTSHIPDYPITDFPLPSKYNYSYKTESPYKCPVCDGTGLVSRPPDIPGDQNTWSANGTGPYKCHACKGSGIIWG